MHKFIETDSALLDVIPELKAMTVLCVDTETTGLDPFVDKVIMLQIGNEDLQVIIDTRKVSLEPLREIIESDTYKILHNAKFDYKMIKTSFGMELGNMTDTMVTEQLLMNGLQKKGFGLKDLVLKYFGEDIDKGQQTTFIGHTGDFTQDQIEYAKWDIIWPIRLMGAMFPTIRAEGLLNVAKLEYKVLPVFADIELNGVLVDEPLWNELTIQADQKKAEYKKELDNLLIENGFWVDLLGDIMINYGSSDQVKAMFSELGIELEGTGKDVLAEVDHPVAKTLLDYREQEKIVSTYGKTFLDKRHPKTGRIHPTFRQMGTDTGRVSCTNPNLQNIKSNSDFRNAFIAGEGRKTITADYSGCELRIIAQASKDPVFIKAFCDGVDLHSVVASDMFEVEVTKDKNPELRKATKNINFGLAYGMSAFGLSKRIGKTEDEAQVILDKYFETYPAIKGYLDSGSRQAISRGFSTTMLGRKRYYDLKKAAKDRSVKSAIGRRGKNTPIQGTNGDMVKLALVMVDRSLKASGLDAIIVNTVHDEIVVECAEDVAEEAAKILHDEMVAAGERFITVCPVEIDYTIKDHWSK